MPAIAELRIRSHGTDLLPAAITLLFRRRRREGNIVAAAIIENSGGDLLAVDADVDVSAPLGQSIALVAANLGDVGVNRKSKDIGMEIVAAEGYLERTQFARQNLSGGASFGGKYDTSGSVLKKSTLLTIGPSAIASKSRSVR